MKRSAYITCIILSVVCLRALPAAATNLTVPVAGRVSVELLFSDAGFSNTLSVLTPGVAAAISGCNLEPAGGLGGVHLLSEKQSQRGCRVDLDADPAAPGIQGFAANTTFEFGMCAQTDADPACEFVWSSDPSKNSDSFDHVATTELYPADFPGQVFRLAWEDLENGGDEDFNDLIAVVRVELDRDGDGLWDDWEQFGIDTNGDGAIDLDLPALGADPDRQDLFVEIDYLDCNVAGGDCIAGDTHSHAPKADAVSAVVDVFANAPVDNPDGSKGITLHVDIDDAVPHQNQLSIDACFSGAGIGDFDDVKVDPAYFGPANPRRFAYHYAIFGHRLAAVTWSGCAELPGNDFIVTLGDWNTGCIYPGANGTLDTAPTGDDLALDGVIFSGPDLTCDTTKSGDDFQYIASGNSPASDPDGDGLDDRTVGTVQQQAGTLMHELGHNLKLCHGGEYDSPTFSACNTNDKPNYISIMNYAFQTRGIPSSDPDGAGPMTARIDYSEEDLDDLDENNLDETVGVNDGTDDTRHVCPNGTVATGSGSGAIDWNCDSDGGTDTSVAVDANGDGAFAVLTGFDDWENVKLAFQNTEDFEDGVHQTFTDIVEADYLVHIATPVAVAIDIKPFSDPNSVNSKGGGVIPVAICTGGVIQTEVSIDDPANPDGYSNASTNIDLDSIRFAFGVDGEPLGTGTAMPAHDIGSPAVLGDHLTQLVDTDGDGKPDTRIYLDAPNCPGDPAGPDLVVHFPARDTGLAPGVSKACISARLNDGTQIFGCDSVNVVK